MGKKDIYEKVLEDHVEVFADIFNVLLIKDKTKYIDPNKLDHSQTESIYKFGDDDFEQRRDVFKNYGDSNNTIGLHVASLGIENQSTIDTTMPVRIMNYDAASYLQQMKNKGVKNKRHNNSKTKLANPVISIVLNFSDKPWKSNTCLYDLINIPKNFTDLVQNYKIHVFDVAFLDNATIEKFTSDFKEVAKFFKNKRNNIISNDYSEVKHISDVLNLLNYFMSDNSFKDMIPVMLNRQAKGEVITMSTFTENLILKGRQEGEQIGIQKGIQKKNLEIAKIMIENNETDSKIMQYTKLPLEQIQKFRSHLQNNSSMNEMGLFKNNK